MVNYKKDGFELLAFDAEVVLNNEIGKAQQKNQEEQTLKKEGDEEGVLASGVSSLYCTTSSLFASVGNGFIRCWNILKIPHDLKEEGLWDSGDDEDELVGRSEKRKLTRKPKKPQQTRRDPVMTPSWPRRDPVVALW